MLALDEEGADLDDVRDDLRHDRLAEDVRDRRLHLLLQKSLDIID